MTRRLPYPRDGSGIFRNVTYAFDERAIVRVAFPLPGDACAVVYQAPKLELNEDHSPDYFYEFEPSKWRVYHIPRVKYRSWMRALQARANVLAHIWEEACMPVAPSLEIMSADQFRDFTCEKCEAKVQGEPRCFACHLCAVCCECKFCVACDKRCKACPTCSKCKEHCSCWVCDTCGGAKHPTSINRCDACQGCTQGCKCWTCAGCTRLIPRRSRGNSGGTVPCTNCAMCPTCCAKNWINGNRCRHLKFFAPFEPAFHQATAIILRKKNPSPRMLSVEIEVAGTAYGNARSAGEVYRWGGGIVRDGSLPDTGFEINTAPAGGDFFLKEIEDITRALKLEGAVATDRCGAHVHIDARDFTPFDLRRLILLYGKIEPAVFNMVPKERRENHYCVPCAHKYLDSLNGTVVPPVLRSQRAARQVPLVLDLKPGEIDKKKANRDARKSLLTGIYGYEPGKDIAALKKEKYNGARYNALNLHSWVYRGTVECRLMYGTVDYAEITNWGMMWAKLIDYAYKTKEGIIKDLPDNPKLALLKTLADRADLQLFVSSQTKRFRGKTPANTYSPEREVRAVADGLDDDGDDGIGDDS